VQREKIVYNYAEGLCILRKGASVMDRISQINQYPIQNLAYLGDAVMELMVREHLVTSDDGHGVHPSERSLEYVTARAQSEAVGRIIDILTEDEASVYRRGRNNIHAAAPKSTTPAQYRRATGLECLFGYLYLAGRTERMRELFDIAYRICDPDDKR
jgi:ribonuclease-3 family protein